MPKHKRDAAPNELRERILSAAVKQFAERGYGSTSVREVVEAVGCTKPALYYHFSSKEDLYLEAVRTRLTACIDALSAALAEGTTLRGRLERFAAVMLDRVRTQPDDMRLVIKAEHVPSGDAAPEVDLMSLHLQLVDLLTSEFTRAQGRGEIRGDQSPMNLALAFIGMVNIHCIAFLYSLDVSAGAAAGVTELFLTGAMPRG